MKNIHRIAVTVLLASISMPTFARTACEDLKAQLEAKLEAKGVKNFTLTVVPKDEKSELREIGSCDGGTQKILYKRALGSAPASTAANSAAQAATQ